MRKHRVTGPPGRAAGIAAAVWFVGGSSGPSSARPALRAPRTGPYRRSLRRFSCGKDAGLTHCETEQAGRQMAPKLLTKYRLSDPGPCDIRTPDGRRRGAGPARSGSPSTGASSAPWARSVCGHGQKEEGGGAVWRGPMARLPAVLATIAIAGAIACEMPTQPTQPTNPIAPTTTSTPEPTGPCDVTVSDQWSGHEYENEFIPKFNLQFRQVRCTRDTEGGVVLVSAIVKSNNGRIGYRRVYLFTLSIDPRWLCGDREGFDGRGQLFACSFHPQRDWNSQSGIFELPSNTTSYEWKADYKVCDFQNVPCEGSSGWLWPPYPDI